MKRTTTSQFIAKAKSIHGDKYDYSKVKYEKSSIRNFYHSHTIYVLDVVLLFLLELFSS